MRIYHASLEEWMLPLVLAANSGPCIQPTYVCLQPDCIKHMEGLRSRNWHNSQSMTDAHPSDFCYSRSICCLTHLHQRSSHLARAQESPPCTSVPFEHSKDVATTILPQVRAAYATVPSYTIRYTPALTASHKECLRNVALTNLTTDPIANFKRVQGCCETRAKVACCRCTPVGDDLMSHILET